MRRLRICFHSYRDLSTNFYAGRIVIGFVMTPEMCHRREIWSNKLPMVSVKRKNAVQITSCYFRLFNSVGDFMQEVHFIFLHEWNFKKRIIEVLFGQNK